MERVKNKIERVEKEIERIENISEKEEMDDQLSQSIKTTAELK